MSEETPRATNITCNITNTEKAALAIVAAQRGYNTTAAFVRACIDNECASELEAATAFILRGEVRQCTSESVSE